jgi:protein SCO1/2
MRRSQLVGYAIAAMLSAAVSLVRGQEPVDPAARHLEGVDIVEHPDALLPLDVPLIDDQGKSVKLGDYFRSERPVVLTLNYYRCPMLCTLVLNGATKSLSQVAYQPGQDYEIVTISIDPRDTTELAANKKQNYLAQLGKPGAESGWHFTTGQEADVRRIADAIGFAYKYVAERDEYAHAAAIFIATPEGRISRYLYGVEFEPQTVRLSLSEASQGKIGTTLDRILLYCFQYHAATGRYSLAATFLVRLGGVLTMLTLAVLLLRFWRNERNKSTHAPATGH